MAIKRPNIFEMVDLLYDYHHTNATNLYKPGIGLMINGTINKLAIQASVKHCERQIEMLKPNTKKSVFNPERYSDEMVYWIAVKEILLNKMI
jgi:hypothetical protein